MAASWRWPDGAVNAGDSAGLCIGDAEDSNAYWSCFEFYFNERRMYDDMAKSYLINPDTFNENSRLNEY